MNEAMMKLIFFIFLKIGHHYIHRRSSKVMIYEAVRKTIVL